MFLLKKIAQRKAAVDTMDWEDTKKERCKKFLNADYTSSDESEMSEDENGHDVKRFVTKRLSWEGLKLRELKDVLDLAYKRCLSPHLRKLQTERVVGDKVSLRGSPPCALIFTAGDKHACAGKTKLIIKLTKQHVMHLRNISDRKKSLNLLDLINMA